MFVRLLRWSIFKIEKIYIYILSNNLNYVVFFNVFLALRSVVVRDYKFTTDRAHASSVVIPYWVSLLQIIYCGFIYSDRNFVRNKILNK